MKSCILPARLAALPLALASAFAASPALAQNQLKETVVTATRSETRADALVSDVTVITREDIERGTGRTLTEVIARASGVQMAANGGLGKTSSLFVRGTESRHVLLLVDGVRYGSATAGQPNFDTIPLESIERIEVLKGPASALYGSDAVGGVVQVFTRRGTAAFTPYASVTAGEYEHGSVAAGFTGSSGNLGYALGVQTLREKGFSATNPQVPFGAFNPDADGFSQSSANLALDWKFAPGWKADARLLYSDVTSQFDNGPGAFDVRSGYLTRVSSVGLEGQLTANWKSRVSFGLGEDLLNSWTAAVPTRFNSVQNQWSWLNEIATPAGKVLLGYEQNQQKIDSTTAYTVADRSLDSWMAGLTGSTGAHSWQLNARRDNDSQFGGASTGLAGYGYRFAPNWRARASYGTSFKAPTFNQLYFPVFGNPTTQPESGANTELGLSYSAGEHLVNLVAYQNRIQGFITTLPVVANVPYAKLQGWTLSYEGRTGALGYRAALDGLDARNELTNLKLVRRADSQLTAGVDYATGPWKFGATLLSQSERFDDAANTVRLGAFATLDLSVDYQVAKDWSVQGRLVNAGDAVYQTALGFNQVGRSAYVTLRYQPK